MEQAFDELDAPVGRLHTEPVPIPFSPTLESAVAAMPEKIAAAARAVLQGQPLVPQRAKGPGPLAIPAAMRENREAVAPAVAAFKKIPEAGEGAALSATKGIPLIMPNMDLIVTKTTVVKWLKQTGNPVKTGEPVVEIETDKAVAGVESPANGTLT
jgi:2-oxoisovalerate dehydrogenase E1 component